MNSPHKSQASLDSSSSEDLDNICIDHELTDIDIAVPSRKPHFLDYDAIPPPGFEDQPTFVADPGGSSTINGFSGENVKMDKKYERDGEISDYELAASGFTKKDIFPQRKMSYENERLTGARRKKHFLDENPIPPDYMVDKEREHRSLDRNFERQGEYCGFRNGRKHSLDREIRSRKFKEPGYSYGRDDSSSPSHRNNWPSDRPIENNVGNLSSQDNQLSNNKVECVYTFLSMLGSQDPIEMSKKLLELSRTPETCITLRHSGCIPLLVQMMHSDSDAGTRKRAAAALHNIVHYQPDDKTGRREAKVLRLIEHVMDYCSYLKSLLAGGGEVIADDPDRHPLAAVSSLMKVSFDEEHRHAMCQLGALQAIANIFYLDHAIHGPKSEYPCCNSLRRYALMALTNLTFGDGNNKALLCANREFMEALVAQLDSAPDDLLQVTGSVLRNLSWRADNNMKTVLNEIGTVTALTKAAMQNKNENTLKSILSALWNLSAHCSTNKAEFCAVDGALAFLVDMLTYEGPSKTLTIVENAGGILRNVSSRIAVREDYRVILRQKNCLGILLQQLKSESLTVVSNACGILWNLSARAAEDQKFLWDNGAVPMLRSLIHSKHKMIAEGSSAALKNLQNYRPTSLNQNAIDPIARSMGLKELPTLNARKQRTLEQALNQDLSETYDNIDVVTPPKEKKDFISAAEPVKHWNGTRLTKSALVSKSESRDSIISAKSDSVYEKLRRRGCSAPPDHGDLIDQETEYPIDYSAKYNSEVVENQIEDTVKCYETEGTPYVISNAASVSDLRNPKPEEPALSASRKAAQPKPEPIDVHPYGLGAYTPEKPINYCEEGTPGYFSRYESLSSLEESPQNFTAVSGKAKPEVVEEESSVEASGGGGMKSLNSSALCVDINVTSNLNLEHAIDPADCGSCVAASPSIEVSTTAASLPIPIAVNSAQETPLMFSRHSSVDSLASVEPNTADDKSSVVSDFSRMASGIISPSEIPDSPTQSMPQSPRRNSNVNIPYVQPNQSAAAQKPIALQPLRSVFEDDISMFHVENTPAQFSSATSLSNLSLDDEQPVNDISEGCLLNMSGQSDEPKTQPNAAGNSASTDGEDDHEDNKLLATCINMGIQRGSPASKLILDESVVLTFHKKDDDFKEYHVNDFLQPYYTEDTPAVLSKVGSNSNLSVLSINTDKRENANLSDESSVSDGSNDLLEQCIRQGMQKSTSKERDLSAAGTIQSTNPIAMLRCGGLPSYLPVRDETNNFVVEDSPCTFSVLSELSSLTVGSDIAGPANLKRLVDKPADPKSNIKEHRHRAEDSLSSISIDSEDENLLNQAIAAGFNKTTKGSENVSIRKLETDMQHMHMNNLRDANDSLSSIDSSDSNDNQGKNLFDLCVRAGMNKQKKPEKHTVSKHPVPIRQSQLPVAHTPTRQTPVQVDRDRRRERERRDEQLLKECINIGIASKCGRVEAEIKPPARHVKQVLASTDFNQRFVTGGAANNNNNAPNLIQSNNHIVPKNGETTSVAVLEQQQQLEHTTLYNAPSTAPGVEMKEHPDGINIEQRSNHQQLHQQQQQPQQYQPRMLQRDRLENSPNITGSDLLQSSQGSLNLSEGNYILEQSNEYPALKLSNIDFEDSVNESSFEMEMSNEFLVEKDDIDVPSTQAIHDKHKDPDLMLKSVERLTHELVSTAEFLRTTATNNNSEMDSNDISHKSVSGKKSEGNSNNTWNEDTCPNDVSFPSVSITAPMIASLNDDETSISDFNLTSNRQIVEVTPTNENVTFIIQQHDVNLTNEFSNPAANTQPSSLDTETDTLVNDDIDGTLPSIESAAGGGGIQFQVGGEVQSQFGSGIPHFISSGPISFDSSSTLSNSTIIAMEAHKLADQLMENMSGSVTSLDLDNIRPPSGMDCISLSGFGESIPLSPQLSRMRKKSLPPGLMARRALSGGQGCSSALSGSAESVNSMCNLLDNIKPPSLMDELLDSMISVASITSEVVDQSLLTGHSHYETAYSDGDNDTTILQSCLDALPADGYDESNGTPIPSDFSSVESTPKKTRGNAAMSGVKRALTPKQKRRIVKDRFKTYTIAADFILKESYTDEQLDQEHYDDEEFLKIEIDHNVQREENENRNGNSVISSPSKSAKRRSLNPDRYRTRTISIDPATFTKDQEGGASTEEDTEELSSIRAMTKQFKYITPPEGNFYRGKTSNFRFRLMDDDIHRTESDFNSMEFDQNSETESCDQNLNRTDDEVSPKRSLMPRIFKPTSAQPLTDDSGVESATVIEPEVKVVRGRKKPAYVSPYRRSALSGNSPRTTSPKSQIGTTVVRATNLSSKANPDIKKNFTAKIGNKAQTIASKTHVVVNKSDIVNKTNAVKSRLVKPGFGSSPRKKNAVVEKNQLNKRLVAEAKSNPNIVEEPALSTSALERQGTFVKDEPSNAAVPIVSSLPQSPNRTSKLPTKTATTLSMIPKSPVKSGLLASKCRPPVQKSASTEVTGKRKSLSTITSKMRSIASSATDLSKRKMSLIGVKKSPSVPTVPQRSNSNASLRTPPQVAKQSNTNPPSRSNSTLTSRPAVSRIAGIWKKTDDAKKSPHVPKTTTGKPPVGLTGTKLIRSSTFDNSPTLVKTSDTAAPSTRTNTFKTGITGISMRNKTDASSPSAASTNVVRRLKTSTTDNVPAVSDEEAATKRISRLGTFINVDGDCQVAG